MFIPDKAHKQNFLNTNTKSVCADLKYSYFAHRIHSSTLWCSEKRPVHYTQSASCSSSSVESSAKVTVMSESESDGISDEFGSRQTNLFLHFEGPRRTFNPRRWDWDLVICSIFFFSDHPKKFCKMNSLLFYCPTTRIWL